MAQRREPKETGPGGDDDVAPVSLPEKASPPAKPASEVAGTEPPRGRPDSPDRNEAE